MRANQKGFTLLELSVVIVIIGLLIAGVTSGTQLLKSAEVTKQVSQLTQMRSYYTAFRATHAAVPGDFARGFVLWGSATCTNNSVHSASDGCNGNGDGNLGGATSNEGVLLWRHLFLSGIMPTNITTVYTGGTAIIGTHVPAGVVRNSGFYTGYDSYYGIVDIQDMYILGSSVSGDMPYGAVLKPSDAKIIDQKIDDGHPIRGRAFSGTSPVGATGTCVNGSGGENLTNATDYTLSNNSVACRMVFIYN